MIHAYSRILMSHQVEFHVIILYEHMELRWQNIHICIPVMVFLSVGKYVCLLCACIPHCILCGFKHKQQNLVVNIVTYVVEMGLILKWYPSLLHMWQITYATRVVFITYAVYNYFICEA